MMTREKKQRILSNSKLTDMEKLKEIFDISKEALKAQDTELYYAILAVLDNEKKPDESAYFNTESESDHDGEISKEENDRRIFMIDLYNGLCPVCNVYTVERIEDLVYPHGFKQGQYVFHCKKCGVVARKEVDFIQG